MIQLPHHLQFLRIMPWWAWLACLFTVMLITLLVWDHVSGRKIDPKCRQRGHSFEFVSGSVQMVCATCGEDEPKRDSRHRHPVAITPKTWN